MIDFPASPAAGQLFAASNGVTYRWNELTSVWDDVSLSPPAGFGWYHGSGAPIFAAAANSLYSRIDGNSTTTRLYVNTDGGVTWAHIVTSG